MMGLTGDFAGLGRMAANLRRLASVPSRASKSAAKKIDALVQRGYDQGAGPDGVAWKPLRPATIAKGRHPPPLTYSRAMRDGTRVVPMRGAGISITFDAPYSTFHHTGFTVGTLFVAPRPVAPIGAFPREWDAALAISCADAVRSTVGTR